MSEDKQVLNELVDIAMAEPTPLGHAPVVEVVIGVALVQAMDPGRCSEGYAGGWREAEEALFKGCSPEVNSPKSISGPRLTGFTARMETERRFRSGRECPARCFEGYAVGWREAEVALLKGCSPEDSTPKSVIATRRIGYSARMETEQFMRSVEARQLTRSARENAAESATESAPEVAPPAAKSRAPRP